MLWHEYIIIFSQIYRENGSKKQSRKIWKTYMSAQKEQCVMLEVKNFVVVGEISTIRETKFFVKIEEERWFESTSKFIKTPHTEDSSMQMYKPFSFQKTAPGTLLNRSLLGNWFLTIHFTMLSHPGTWRPLQAWSRLFGHCSCWHLVAILVMLVLMSFRMQEL